MREGKSIFGGGVDGLPQPVTPVTGFAMTGFLQEVRCKSGGGMRAPRPTERFVGADDSVRPASITQHLVGQGPCALPGAEKICRAVGEIGEALPVADEASRFRGSAPIGGHDSDRESVGTTVGNRRPLRKCILRCVGEGLCPSRGRGRTPPLRKRYKGRRKRIPQSRLRRASPL